jgi:small-conductance mechanosensitive channel
MRLPQTFAVLVFPALSARAAEEAGEFPRIREVASAIWNYQVVHADNIQISVGKIVIGVLGLVLALIIARTLSGFTSRAIRRRFTLATEHAEVLQKGVFYLLATLFVLTILNWLSIPLTVFAFLGGAVAIGIGFGTQALMNNFISGLILLFERGIRVGDLIDVDGNLGRVTKLGSRYSQIRKFDGVEVLVPNSMLLEKNVINWTLSDSTHRYNFAIGFAYGTATSAILRVLRQALDEHA